MEARRRGISGRFRFANGGDGSVCRYRRFAADRSGRAAEQGQSLFDAWRRMAEREQAERAGLAQSSGHHLGADQGRSALRLVAANHARGDHTFHIWRQQGSGIHRRSSRATPAGRSPVSRSFGAIACRRICDWPLMLKFRHRVREYSAGRLPGYVSAERHSSHGSTSERRGKRSSRPHWPWARVWEGSTCKPPWAKICLLPRPRAWEDNYCGIRPFQYRAEWKLWPELEVNSHFLPARP